MTDLAEDDRTLLALVAVFAPARATALLSRLLTDGEQGVRAEAPRLAEAPRHERLAALGAALQGAVGDGTREAAPGQRATPALRRLVLERRHSSAG